MRTTLKQIAEATGLSVTTVSQVLNDRPCRVSAENRQKILETAQELNYRKNLVAVSLVKGTTDTIGLAISDISNSFFSALAKGAEDECQKNNWNVILCNSNDRHEQEMKNLRMLADKGASGVIFGMASETTEEMARECTDFLRREHIPYLFVDRYVDTRTCGIISVDHTEGGYLAADYLIRKGHRKIACITGPLNLIDSRQRLDGFEKALRENGLQSDPLYVAEGRYNFESGREAAGKLLARGIKIDAIFAFNDMMAIGAMRTLSESGYRVPEDISVIGYDDIFMDELLETPLTTIRQPMEEMGRIAARQLISGKIGYKSRQHKTILKPELVVRRSVLDRPGISLADSSLADSSLTDSSADFILRKH